MSVFSTTLVKNRCINTSVVFISLSIFYSISSVKNEKIRSEKSLENYRTQRAIKDQLISKWFQGGSSLAPIIMKETRKYNSHHRSNLSGNATDVALKVSDHLTQLTPTILCAVLLSATNQSKSIFLSNINLQHSVDRVCDWAVVCYGGDDALLSSMCNEGKQSGASIVFCEMVQSMENVMKSLWANRADTTFPLKDNNLQNGDRGYYPKPMLFFSLLKHLQRYRWLWLMDDDIDIKSVNITRFLAAMSSDDLRPPILIAQPLVKGYTSYASLKWDTWLPENSTRMNSTYHEMKREGFVEMVAPLLDCRFFHWFVTVVIPLIVRPMYLLGADHGIDRIWCQAAKFFHEQQRQREVPYPRSLATNSHRRDNRKGYVFDNSSVVSTSSSVCGLFVSEGDFIRHLNLKSSVSGKSQDAAAQHAKNQTTMNEIMKAIFPEWFVHFH